MTIKENILAINKWESRRGNSVDGVIIHSMAGNYRGTLAWFNNPKVIASAHYLISKTGEISKCVEEINAAWHSGEVTVGYKNAPLILQKKWGVNPNLFTIGLELEDENNKEWSYPQKQYFATVELVVDICKRHKLPVNADTILMHKQTNPIHRSDPIGSWNHERFVADVGESFSSGGIVGANAPMYRYETIITPSAWAKGLNIRSGASTIFDKIQVKNWLGRYVDRVIYPGNKIRVKGFVKGERVSYDTTQGEISTQFWWVTTDNHYIWSGGTSYMNGRPVVITLKEFPAFMQEAEK